MTDYMTKLSILKLILINKEIYIIYKQLHSNYDEHNISTKGYKLGSSFDR